MNAIALIFLSAFDAVFYGNHEKKGWLSGSLFKSYEWDGHTVYPYYRILQGTLDIIGIYFTYKLSGTWATIGMIIAWYLMTKEYLYYVFTGDLKLLEKYEVYNEDVYWLKRIYFAGKWLFKNGFNRKRFEFSFYLGVLILIISNLI